MSSTRLTIAVIGVLSALAAALRLPGLRALPIFGDEAIFLRLAGIIRAEPLAQLWSPLRAPSAPLHPWLLALWLPVSSDPVWSGRLLSVLCGVLLVSALAWAAWRLTGDLITDAERVAPMTSVAAAILVTVSPFLVFSDRIARVDSLFALGTALAVGLSVSLAGQASSRVGVRFGLLMGFVMLMRQAVSYPLWLLPLFAWLCLPRKERRTLIGALLLSGCVAFVLWAPMLLAPGSTDLTTRIFHLGLSRPPLGLADRGVLIARNLELAASTFWLYLTPPVCFVAVAGLAVAAVAHRRLFWFLSGWAAIVLLPPVVFAIDYFPRYALPAALPLLVSAALTIAFVWAHWKRWFAALLVTGMIAWSLKATLPGISDWRRWSLLPVDRKQFMSGWSGGYASEGTAHFLVELSRKTRISVILPKVSGNPSDALWLLLDKKPNIRLYYAEDFPNLPVLVPAGGGQVRLQGDIWAGRPVETVTLNPVSTALFVCTDPVFLGYAGWAPAVVVVPSRNPGARLLARFQNPPETKRGFQNAVSVFELR